MSGRKGGSRGGPKTIAKFKSGEARLRGETKQKRTEAGSAGVRVSAPTPEGVRRYLDALLCPFCGRGPWKVVAAHVSRAHGVAPDELREMAGLGYSATLTDPETHEKKRRLGRERGMPPGSREALHEANAQRTAAGHALRRTSAAGFEANRQNYRRRLERLRAVEELRHLTEPELRVVASAQALAAQRLRFEEETRTRDEQIVSLIADPTLTMREIAQRVGVGVPAVSAALKRHGVELDGRARQAAPRARAGNIQPAKEASSRKAQRDREELSAAWMATARRWADLIALSNSRGVSAKTTRTLLKRWGLPVPDGRVETTNRPSPRPKRHDCDVDGCPREHVARGLCRYHYQQWRIAQGLVPACSKEGCEKPVTGRGLCSTHYSQLSKADWERGR